MQQTANLAHSHMMIQLRANTPLTATNTAGASILPQPHVHYIDFAVDSSSGHQSTTLETITKVASNYTQSRMDSSNAKIAGDETEKTVVSIQDDVAESAPSSPQGSVQSRSRRHGLARSGAISLSHSLAAAGGTRSGLASPITTMASPVTHLGLQDTQVQQEQEELSEAERSLNRTRWDHGDDRDGARSHSSGKEGGQHVQTVQEKRGGIMQSDDHHSQKPEQEESHQESTQGQQQAHNDGQCEEHEMQQIPSQPGHRQRCEERLEEHTHALQPEPRLPSTWECILHPFVAIYCVMTWMVYW